MKTITLEMIQNKLSYNAQSSRGCGLISLGFLAMILIAGGAAIFSPLTLVPILIFGTLGFYLLRDSARSKNSLKGNAFFIASDICVNKRVEPGSDEGDAYILVFQNGLDHTISSDDVFFSRPGEAGDDQWLHEATQIGDRFYMVCSNADGHPLFIFPAKLCQLNMADFTEENGVLRPRTTQ